MKGYIWRELWLWLKGTTGMSVMRKFLPLSHFSPLLGKERYMLLLFKTPVQIPVRDCNSIPAESMGGDVRRYNPLSLMSISRSISASETLPPLKLIIRSHRHNSSSKFYSWSILLFFGMHFWQAECLQTPLKSAGIRGAWQRKRPFA